MSDDVQWAKLQTEICAWAVQNFGDTPSQYLLLGMVEEFGELQTATNASDAKDAVADLLIFMANFCQHEGVTLADIISSLKPPELEQGWPKTSAWISISLGKLAHHVFKRAYGLRGDAVYHQTGIKTNLIELCQQLTTFSALGGYTLLEVMTQVWAQVSQRDWKARPATG